MTSLLTRINQSCVSLLRYGVKRRVTKLWLYNSKSVLNFISDADFRVVMQLFERKEVSAERKCVFPTNQAQFICATVTIVSGYRGTIGRILWPHLCWETSKRPVSKFACLHAVHNVLNGFKVVFFGKSNYLCRRRCIIRLVWWRYVEDTVGIVRVGVIFGRRNWIPCLLWVYLKSLD